MRRKYLTGSAVNGYTINNKGLMFRLTSFENSLHVRVAVQQLEFVTVVRGTCVWRTVIFRERERERDYARLKPTYSRLPVQ